jgi:hypothetical protein
MARASSSLFLLLLLLGSIALATAATTNADPPAPPQPQPGPPERWDWRECEDAAPHTKHVLAVDGKDGVCLDPYPIEIGKPWSLDIALRHRGRHEIRPGATMTLRVYALKHLLVYSTTQDFCTASKKRGAGSSSSFVNMIARRLGAGDEEEEESGCPLRAGEKTMLHFDGEWSSWAPESDKYSLRVLVHSHERPHPTNELMCLDIDVVARKPPSESATPSVAAS